MMGNSRPNRRKKRAGGRRKKSFKSLIPRKIQKYWVEVILGCVIFALFLGIMSTFSDTTDEEQFVGDIIEQIQRPEDLKETPPSPEKKVAAIPLPVSVASPKRRGPRIVIIIDDLGSDMGMADRLLKIDAPLAFAVLPHLAHSKSVAIKAKRKGKVVMLHLPMEPQSPKYKPGPGALTISHSEKQIRETIAEDINSVPGIDGVNNHMGSKFTADNEKMGLALKELRRRGLFFVDSRTTSKSVAYDLAKSLGVPTATRNVFLDNDRDVALISEQILKLADQALMYGAAIGIGHGYKQTAQALEETLDSVRSMGVAIVPVFDLLEPDAN